MKGLNGTTVDYDKIAPDYDRRFNVGDPGSTEAVLMALVNELSARRILEVGCGTAYWLAGLRPVAAQLFGLDLSSGMLAQARQHGSRLFLVRGRAADLPFPGQEFDLVYSVNALHHFDQPEKFIAEARRLLRPGGALAVIGLEPRHPGNAWYVYQYFEGTYETDLSRYPSSGTVLDWIVAAGFERVTWQISEHIDNPKHGQAVLDDPFLDQNATSQLALLTSDAFTAGIRRIREALASAQAKGEVLSFPVSLHLHLLVGRANRG